MTCGVCLGQVLRDGRIVESGTHWQLLKQPDSFYAHLWHNQQKVHEDGTATSTL